MTLTLESMRADIARILQEEPGAIGDDENLIDFGLDSIRAMVLINQWNQAGARLELTALAAQPTLGSWWAMAQQAQL